MSEQREHSVPDRHESHGRTRTTPRGPGLIPGDRARLGDGTLDPGTLPSVPGTRRKQTLTRDEYYEPHAPTPKRTPSAARERHTHCVNVNCTQPLPVEPYRKGRCAACADYYRK